MDRNLHRGVLLSFAAYAAYAFSDASIKLLHGSLDPFAVAFLGAVLGFAAVPFLRAPGEGWRHLFVTVDRPLWLLRAGAGVAGSVGSVLAFTRLPMAEAFALIFLLPAFVTLLSVLFLGERVGRRRWAAVVLGFAGVLVVLRPGFRALDLGHLGAVFGGLSGAVTIVVMRALGGRERPISLYGAGLFGPLLVCGVLMLPGFAWPGALQWACLAGYGLLAALANVLIMLASRRAPASLVAPPQYSQMLWAILFGATLFGDHPDAATFLGAGIIVASGLLTLLREKVRRPPGADLVPPAPPQ